MQLLITKHFFGKLIPPLTLFVWGLYVVYIVTCSCHVGRITLIYVVWNVNVRHLSIDEVVQ